jgi:hypothetical protein
VCWYNLACCFQGARPRRAARRTGASTATSAWSTPAIARAAAITSAPRGRIARAAIEEAHARLCARGEWILNEKRIFERAGLARVQAAFADTPRGGALPGWVDAVAAELTRAA